MEIVVRKNILVKYVKIKAAVEEINATRDNLRKCKFWEYCAFFHSDPNNAAEEELKLLKWKLDDDRGKEYRDKSCAF